MLDNIKLLLAALFVAAGIAGFYMLTDMPTVVRVLSVLAGMAAAQVDLATTTYAVVYAVLLHRRRRCRQRECHVLIRDSVVVPECFLGRTVSTIPPPPVWHSHARMTHTPHRLCDSISITSTRRSTVLPMPTSSTFFRESSLCCPRLTTSRQTH